MLENLVQCSELASGLLETAWQLADNSTGNLQGTEQRPKGISTLVLSSSCKIAITAKSICCVVPSVWQALDIDERLCADKETTRVWMLTRPTCAFSNMLPPIQPWHSQSCQTRIH